jgi:predicted nucleotidyltransferase
MPKKRRAAPDPDLPRWYRGADIPMSVIRRYAREVAERFQPDKIILFGSYAYGTPHADSDVDILVIMPARNELDQAVRIDGVVEAPFPLDLIVRTPKNMAWRLEEGDSFLREIVTKGKVLYEKTDVPDVLGKSGRGARSLPSVCGAEGKRGDPEPPIAPSRGSHPAGTRRGIL